MPLHFISRPNRCPPCFNHRLLPINRSPLFRPPPSTVRRFKNVALPALPSVSSISSLFHDQQDFANPRDGILLRFMAT